MIRRVALLSCVLALAACKREARPTVQATPRPTVAVASPVVEVAPAASPAPAPAPPPPVAHSFSLTLPSGNQNGFAKPNLWAYVPAAYRADKPLRLIVLFHGFNSCIEALVADAGVPCKSWDAPRAALDLPAQIDRSGTSAVVLVPQLAFDDKIGDPGVLDSGPALEKLAREALEGPLADVVGPRKPEDVERVAMIAISGGYQALYAALGPEGHGAFGDRVRDVLLLDAYYAEEGAVDAWMTRYLSDFSSTAQHPRHLSVVYSWLESTRVYSQAFAARAGVALQHEGLSASILHRDVAHEPTVEEFAQPVSFLFSSKEHDDIPKTDIARAISGFGL